MFHKGNIGYIRKKIFLLLLRIIKFGLAKMEIHFPVKKGFFQMFKMAERRILYGYAMK